MSYANPLHGLDSDGEPSNLADAARWTAPAKPEVITVCGSMRFYPLMLRVAEQETARGRIVLMPFVTVHDDQQDGEHKRMLDELHRAKIRMSDRVIVVSDETGYYGESTSREIQFAGSLGLPVEHRCVSAPVSGPPQAIVDFEARIRETYRTTGKIAAIRLYRNETRSPGYVATLAHSKAEVERICESLVPVPVDNEAAVERIARALHRGAWERDIADGTPLEGNDVDACWSQVGAKYREWYYADARAALVALREGEQ